MQPDEHLVTSNPPTSVSALIVSEVRFLREWLAEALVRHSDIQVCGQSASLPEALAAAPALRPTIVLLDVAFPGSFGTVRKFSARRP